MAAAAVLLASLLSWPALAQTSQLSFPPLAGRVVDAANVLKADERAALERKLKAHEDKTTDQVVVATVPSLGGTSVEDYANRLFRHWRLGQQAKNNGVLLLAAPSERKLRIEVGYGLEGALTDALSKVIVATAVAPKLKQNDFAGGLHAGVDAILSVLTGDAEEWQRRAKVRQDETAAIDPIVVIVVFVLLFFVLASIMRSAGGASRYHRSRSGRWLPIPIGGGWGGGWSGGGGWGGGSSGGFSGGGGSSGGGGASGSW